MLLHQVKHADMPNVGASQTGTLALATANNHHGLLLNCISAVPAALTQAQIETDIASVTITVKQKDGPVIQLANELTPAFIFDCLNDYPNAGKAAYTNAGCLYLPYTRPGRLRAKNWTLAIGMADIESYQVQVEFTAGLATLAVMEVIPVFDRLPVRRLGEHIRIDPLTRATAGTGVETVLNLPSGEPGTAMLGYHLGLGAAPGVIANVESRMNNEIIYDSLDAAMNNRNLRDAGRTPNADYFHVAFDLDGDALPVGMASSFLQRWNWSTAPTAYTVWPEMIYGLGQSNE